ncbi:T9SS type A sorting domain-containing protein [Candidatus Latescibacterota bacterium]
MRRLMILLTIVAVTTFVSGYEQAQSSENKILFSTDRDGNREIYMMDMDGSNQVNLTNSPGDDRWPDWSHDGSKIVFTYKEEFQIGKTQREFLSIMDSDGSNQTRVCEVDYGTWFTISPDDSKIAFVSDRDGDTEIYIMDIDGTNQERLTNSDGYDVYPSWSPDGTEILFSSSRGDWYGIYAINIADKSVRTILNTPEFPHEPEYSPDGNFIAFVKDWEGASEISVVNADGSNLTRVTYSPEAKGTWSPRWSADGSQIVFECTWDDNYEVYIINTDGTNPVNLTNDPGGDYDPVVSPVGIPILVETDTTPKEFVLSQNAPNPFNPTTTIEYIIPAGITEQVNLNIYDLRGALIRSMVDDIQNPGMYSVVWDGTDERGEIVSSGIYLYQLQVGEFRETRRMILVR